MQCPSKRRTSALLAASNASFLDPARLTSVMRRLAAAGTPPDPGWIDTVIDASTTCMGAFSLSELVQMLEAMATMDVTAPPGWTAAFFAASSSLLAGAGPDQSASLLQSLAELGVRPEQDWLGRLLGQVEEDMEDLEPEEAANVAWAIAKWGYRPGDSFLDLVAEQTGELTELSPRGLGRLAWAFASFSYLPPDEWLQEFAFEAILSPELSPRDSASVLWSLAVFQALPDLGWVSRFYKQSEGHLCELPTEALVNALWSLAAFQTAKSGDLAAADFRPTQPWLDEWLLTAQPSLGDLSKTDVLKVLWAVVMMEVKPGGRWLKDLADAAKKHLQAGAYDALEALYITRCVDLAVDARSWVGPPPQRRGGDGWAVRAQTELVYGDEDVLSGLPDESREAGSSSRDGGGAGGSGSSADVRRGGLGQGGSYGIGLVAVPPLWLSELAKVAFDVLGRQQLPPEWRRLNVRFPPYAMPAEEEKGGED